MKPMDAGELNAAMGHIFESTLDGASSSSLCGTNVGANPGSLYPSGDPYTFPNSGEHVERQDLVSPLRNQRQASVGHISSYPLSYLAPPPSPLSSISSLTGRQQFIADHASSHPSPCFAPLRSENKHTSHRTRGVWSPHPSTPCGAFTLDKKIHWIGYYRFHPYPAHDAMGNAMRMDEPVWTRDEQRFTEDEGWVARNPGVYRKIWFKINKGEMKNGKKHTVGVVHSYCWLDPGQRYYGLCVSKDGSDEPPRGFSVYGLIQSVTQALDDVHAATKQGMALRNKVMKQQGEVQRNVATLVNPFSCLF